MLNWDLATFWSGVLDELAAMSDSIEPVVETTAYNTTDPDALNPPTVEFYSMDSDIVEAQVVISTDLVTNVLYLGLVGTGYIDPGWVYSFEWYGQLFALSDGTESSFISLFSPAWVTAPEKPAMLSYR